MHSSTSSQVLATLGFLALSATCAGAFAQESSSRWLSVDMPHGGCSLTAGPDGSAAILFGAMPRWVHVDPGTFSFEQLVKVLRAKSYPQSARRATGSPIGSLSLPDSEDLLLIDDYDVVRALLERAWEARVHPRTPREVEDHNWVSKACSLR